MAPRKDLEKHKEIARSLYLSGKSITFIAETIGISRNSISEWSKKGNWEKLRAANTVSRKEIVQRLLMQIDQKLTTNEWTAEEIVKAASAVEKLDKRTNIITIIEVFTSYNAWLIARMQLDKELTPELVRIMNRYQDLFISEKLGNATAITFEDSDL